MKTAGAADNHASKTRCPICTNLDEYIEIENPQDPSESEESEDFAEPVKRLTIPNARLEQTYEFRNERLLKCPSCGTYYLYRTWAPGGSEDVMRTWIHESIRRLGFLAAHKELHSARYEAYQRSQEYGGSYEQRYQETAMGVQEEMHLLRQRSIEIINDALWSLENKHEYSQQLAELTQQFAPLSGPQQVQEARQREEEVAAYHAEILVDYLQHSETADLADETVRRMASLLADDNEQVRTTIQAGLVQVLERSAEPQRFAAQIIEELSQQSLGTREARDLLETCRGYVGRLDLPDRA